MNQNMKDLTTKLGLLYEDAGGGLLWIHSSDSYVTERLELFMEAVVATCTECVRDVLREDGNTLSYGDAALIQARIKEVTGVSW